MTPFELDSIVNSRAAKEQAGKKPGQQASVAELKRKQELMMGDLYFEGDEGEDFGNNDFGSRLYDKDFAQMQLYE